MSPVGSGETSPRARWEEGPRRQVFTLAELGIGLDSLHGDKFVVGRSTSQQRGCGREIQGCKLKKLGFVDPKCGNEEVNSTPDHIGR